MVKVPVYGVGGDKQGDVELPKAFSAPVRVDVIAKAVRVAQSNRRQRYGASYWAGMMHSTKSAGKGRGMSRVPRIGGSGPGALAPPTVGGRRAHPPEARRDWSEKINFQERRLAIRAGVAATAQPSLVAARGHRLAENAILPLVMADAFENLTKTVEVAQALVKVGVGPDLQRAQEGRHQRAGRGKWRGRRMRTPTSVLVVAARTDKIRRGARNLPGVEVTTPERLNAELLAPGGTPGRLTVYTVGALKQMEAF